MATRFMERRYKVISLGEERAGKTSIIQRFIGNGFDPLRESSLQVSYQEKIVDLSHNIDGKDAQYSISLALWDTAGQERFHALAPIYYRDSNCIILVFDVTDKTSFQRAKCWFNECMRILKGGRKISIAIVGNKTDLIKKRQVSYEEGIGLYKSLVDNDEFFIMDNNGIDPKQYRERCQLLCDGYLRKSECSLWSSRPDYSFNIMPSLFPRKTKQIPFIPMDIYRLCFKFYFVGQRSTIGYFETSAKTNEGINEMIESLIRTALEIDYYYPRPRRPSYQGDLITTLDEPNIKYKQEPGGIWGIFCYVSDFLSSYL